jgi:hypothetical protein
MDVLFFPRVLSNKQILSISNNVKRNYTYIRVMIRPLLFVLFISNSIMSMGQQPCHQVLFTGKVVDTIQPQSFYNLMIVNASTGKGVFGSPNGAFSVYVNNGDSVHVSIRNYPRISLRVFGDSNCRYERSFVVEKNVREIPEVVVKPLKTLQQIKEEREALALRETRDVTGIEVLNSPITALYQAFSKKEQNRQWIAEQTYKDNQRRIVQELLRNYVAYDIISLTEDEFDAFISFLNVDENFLRTATEMELILFIQDKYEHFRGLQNTNRPIGQ